MIQQVTVEQLKKQFRGQLLCPADPGYDEARKIWNGMIDKRPGLIARCSGTGDVVHSVKFARHHGLTVAVRGGGHNIAGKCTSDGGFLIDLSPMKGVRVNVTGRTARAEAGVKLGELDRQTQAFGLATTLGIASDTGISGLTLGGGYGWLAGKYAMTCDNLVSAEVVTADGELLIASEAENADLFWGVRGGGGNLGIVTSFEYQLHPVDHVVGGAVFYPLSTAHEVFPALYEFASTAPEEISTMIAPAAAFGGTPATGIAVCYCGESKSRGEQLLAPVRKLATPLADLIQERSYVQMQSMFDDLFTPGRMYYWKSSLIRTVDESFIDVVIEHATEMPLTPGTFIYMQQLHGAATRIDPSATAFPHRHDHFNCGAMAGWDSPADTEKNVRWSRRCWEAFKPFYERSAYINDLGEEGEQRVREAFGDNYQRLLALKRRYDPNNFFQQNQYISPEAEQANGAA